ncbi:(Fe-S)-binding protein [Sinomonas sp. ASV322]|uniref:(Fe-S)-binding protein n=1 Tax=Sinomonas sp. ASV322 TaxID=3041920 RepID=UPI0027DC3B07|nr:(Fe-S)-binding protein [Sinomonas sp. ASV322]MDQ4502591.1 (Fe-S)-binding protein [Sinomonas sp. ASV322]
MKIALFATCIVDAMYPRVAQATVQILERLGHEVVFPAGQACCGQMHVNSGYFREALPVVENHVRAFEAGFDAGEYDVAVAPSGACVASVKHQHAMVARWAVEKGDRRADPTLAARATAVGQRTYELAQLLTDVLGVTDAAAQLGSYLPATITYHPSCHGMRLLRLGDRQRELLRSVEALDVVDLPDADQCCGFGGTFAVKNADVSSAMLADKVANICGTGASACAGGDASCLMHIGGGLSREQRTTAGGAPVRTVHLAEVLASTRENPLRFEGELSLTGGAR